MEQQHYYNFLSRKTLYLPIKMRKKLKGFSSPMLTDAKGFLSNEFCFLLVQASAKPCYLFKQEAESITQQKTEC